MASQSHDFDTHGLLSTGLTDNIPNEEFVDYELEIVLDCLESAKASLRSVSHLPAELLAR